MNARLRPALAVCAVAIVLVAAAGCGGNPLGLIPVDGRVTFDGGPPPKPCSLTFVPEPSAETSAAGRSRAGRADADEAGKFRASTFRPGDGLLPGRYKVHVVCWEVHATDDTPGVSHVPTGFQAPPLVVPAGERNATYTVDVPIAKTVKKR